MNTEVNCPICWELLNSDKPVTTLCRHKFHKSCLVTWLSKEKMCPICYNINPQYFPIEMTSSPKQVELDPLNQNLTKIITKNRERIDIQKRKSNETDGMKQIKKGKIGDFIGTENEI